MLSNAINYPSKVQPHILGQDMGPLISEVAEAILKAGYFRQSTASTTAADAWDEGHQHCFHVENPNNPIKGNPYRVAEPEGDGGNE